MDKGAAAMKKRGSQQKKKRNMKSIVLCLAGMLFLLAWTGCGGREGSGTGAESSAEETETGAEKTEAGDGGAGSAVRRGWTGIYGALRAESVCG